MESIFNENGSLKSAEEIRQNCFFEMLDKNPKFVDQLADSIESRIVVAPIDIATLGPSGTDSEAAAKKILEEKGLPGEVVLCDSFEAAKKHAIENNSYFLIPAAYVVRVRDGSVKDTWGDFNFREMDRLETIDAVVSPLKDMGVAKNKDCNNPQSVALHPATDVFAEKYVPDLRREYILSKPLAVKECSEGKADMCIGSIDVIERFENLEIVEIFKPKMVWVLYKRR